MCRRPTASEAVLQGAAGEVATHFPSQRQCEQDTSIERVAIWVEVKPFLLPTAMAFPSSPSLLKTT